MPATPAPITKKSGFMGYCDDSSGAVAGRLLVGGLGWQVIIFSVIAG